MKSKIHSLMIEGILFCGSGLGLLSYSLLSYSKAFNKTWAESPYLFPLLVGLALIGLSVWLFGEGILAVKKEQATGKTSKPFSGEKTRWVVVVMIMCVLYYLAMAYLKIPPITIGGLTFSFYTFETATVVFLIAMMLFMGVRKPPVLVLVPIGTAIFLSFAFRTCLHVLLP